MSAGRPLEPAGNGRPRWMAAAGAPTGAPVTESGVQVDSSVAHQLTEALTHDLAEPLASVAVLVLPFVDEVG